MYKFKICNEFFQINNCKKELDEKLKELVSTFDDNCEQKCNYEMTINEDTIKISSAEKTLNMRINVTERDLYQLFYFFIYYCLNNSNRCVIHSAVASKNGKAILLLGTFGAGKTTLSIELAKQGFEINSADHSLIEVVDHELYFVAGTRRVKFNGNNTYLPKSAIAKKLKIDDIYYLIGMCDQGKVSIDQVNDKIRKAKKLWTSITWVYTNPLQSFDNVLLSQLDNSIARICKSIANCNLDMHVCRGDAVKLALEINKKY